VTRAEVVLEALQHAPPVDDRQLDVQRNRVDPLVGDEGDPLGALGRDQGLEAVLVREVD
jgi:hypothetical protein